MKKIILYIILAGFAIILLFSGLFAVNGLLLANNEIPISGITSHPPKTGNADTIKIMAYNIAKVFIHKGGIDFRDEETIRKRLEKIAQVIKTEQPDIVFLSEAVFECTPCPINQVTFLANAAGMHSWAFGENYNFGLPFYRIIGGNAIISRFPVKTIANPSLSGRQPFYVTKNNRRVLWCSFEIKGQEILAASVHNDSYSRKNNLVQAKQLLDYKSNRAAIMAGDFNSNPGEPPIELIRNSGQFKASFEGPPTFPAGSSKQKIDFIFAPANWELIEHKVIKTNASDHYPVVSVFGM